VVVISDTFKQFSHQHYNGEYASNKKTVISINSKFYTQLGYHQEKMIDLSDTDTIGTSLYSSDDALS
jgi:hypothetical protein